MAPEKPRPAPVNDSEVEPTREPRDAISPLMQDPVTLLASFPGLPLPEQVNLFLLAPAELRREFLLSSTDPGGLISHLSVQEAYMTLKEIGYPDAAPLLAHMTPAQLRFWTDLDTWDKEDFRPETLLHFLELLHACGQDRLALWVAMIDPEPLVLALRAFGMVTKFDIFKDPMEEQDDLPPFETFDGYYRYHCLDEAALPHMKTLLRILHTETPERYGMIMESAYQDLPPEVQDEALRFRNARLADRGVPCFEEALGIYRPLTEEAFRLIVQSLPLAREDTGPGSVVFPMRWLPQGGLVRKALRSLASRPEADALRMELASLGNRVVVADGMDAGNPECMKAALQKVSSYLTIGLEHLGCRNERAAASRILESRLMLLFRLGYTQVHRLQETARPLLDRTRFRWAGQLFCLAGTPFEEILRGLSRPRPLFYEGIHPGNFLGFREFQSLQDIRTSEHRLSAVRHLFDFFSRRDLSPDAIKITCLEGGWGDRADCIGWMPVLQTLRVNGLLRGSEAFRLLLPEEVREFARRCFLEARDAGGRTLDPAYTPKLVGWILGQMGVVPPPVRQILEDYISAGAERLEEELGGLGPDTIPDPRFVQALCMNMGIRSE